MAQTSLLFIGYSLKDWTFRVLFRGLISTIPKSGGNLGVTVQLTEDPLGTPKAIQQQEYLNKYFSGMNIRVYWGTARNFAQELRQRWEDFSRGV